MLQTGSRAAANGPKPLMRSTFRDWPLHQPGLGPRGLHSTSYKRSPLVPLDPPQDIMNTRRNTEDTLVDELTHDPESELSVTFYPPLYLQRRLWVLNILRAESVAQASSRVDLYRCRIGTMTFIIAINQSIK